MKKIAKIVLTTAAILTASQAMAKTEGSYLSLSAHKATAEHLRGDRNGRVEPYRFESNKTNLGVDYKYAINVSGDFFVAPGVFFDRIGTKSKEKDNPNQVSIAINNRYGAKFDIGYDISDKSAIYFTNGVSVVNYKLDHSDANGEGNSDSIQTLNKKATAYFYGFGLMTNVNKDVSLGVEYNTQSFKARTLVADSGFDSGALLSDRYKNKIDMFKLSVSYHF